MFTTESILQFFKITLSCRLCWRFRLSRM